MARLIFDLDGTLVHSAPTIAAAANGMLTEIGREPLPLATILSYVGHGMRRLVQDVLTESGGVPEEGVDVHLTSYRRIYFADPLTGTEVYPGVSDALATLAAAGHGLAVCTQKPDAPALAILQGYDLMPPITALTGGDSLPGVLKPDRRLFDHAAEQLPPGRAVMIGDSETDALTAKAAGALFLLHLGGYNHLPPESLTNAGVFAHWAELPALVDAALARG